jgi:hypothetical protein
MDLLTVGDGDNKRVPPFTFAERYSSNGYVGMIRSNEWKYLYRQVKSELGEETQEWIFDLRGDPAELENVVGRDKRQDSDARKQFLQFRELLARSVLQRDTQPPGQQDSMDESMRKKLKALGYVR